MQDIKIAFFDIDGTLIDFATKEISPKTVEALQKLKANGVKLVISTGRGPMLVPKFEGVEFDAFVTFNGSYCHDQENEIFSNEFLKEDLKIILENADKMNKSVAIATTKRLAANAPSEDLSDYFANAKLDLEIADDFDVLVNDRIYQLMIGVNPSEYEEILKDTTFSKIEAWWDRAVDIIPANGGKGIGVQAILDHFGFKPNQAICFGDGDNDIDMFRVVENCIAMGNASENLKRVAKDVCLPVSQDGIYEFLKAKGLI